MDGSNSKKTIIKLDVEGKTESTDQDGINQENELKPRLDSIIRKTSAARESTLGKSQTPTDLHTNQETEEQLEPAREEEESGKDENELDNENDEASEEEEREIAEAFEQFVPQASEAVSVVEIASAEGLQQCQVIVGKAKERHDLVDEYLRLKAELKYEEKKNAYLQDRIYKTSLRKGIIDESKLKRDEAKHRRKSDNIRLILRRKMLTIRAFKREQRRQLKRMEESRSKRSKRKRSRRSKSHRRRSKARQSFANSVIKKDDEDHDHVGSHSHSHHHQHRRSRAESHGHVHGDDKKDCSHSRESKHHHRRSHSHARKETSAGHEHEHRKNRHHNHTHHRHHKDKHAKDGEADGGKKEIETKDNANVQTLSVSKNVPKSAKVKHLRRMHRTKSIGTSLLTDQERKNKKFDFGKANPTFVLKGRSRLYDQINNEFKYDWLIRRVIIHLRKERKYAFYHENNLKRQACKRDLWKKAHEQKLREILHLLRTYSEEAVDSNTGHRIPRASTEQFCKEIAHIHSQLCDAMVLMFKSRRGLELSLRRLEASEVQGEGLQMLEYEQLRSGTHLEENQTLKDRLGDRVKEVDNIKDKITHAIQVLAHFRNKMFSMNYLIAEGNEVLTKVNDEVYDVRGQSELMARRHEIIKREEQGLVVESGLLDNTPLLRDYERTHFHVQDLKNEKRTLTQELDRYTKEISEIKKRISEFQTDYPNIYAKQKARIEGRRAEKKRQRLSKFNKVRDQC